MHESPKGAGVLEAVRKHPLSALIAAALLAVAGCNKYGSDDVEKGMEAALVGQVRKIVDKCSSGVTVAIKFEPGEKSRVVLDYPSNVDDPQRRCLDEAILSTGLVDGLWGSASGY